MAKSINSKEIRVYSEHLEKQFINVIKDNSMENFDGSIVIKTNKEQVKEREPFIKMFQKGMLVILNGISPVGAKMLLYFMNESIYGNFVEIDQRKIQEKLSMSRTSVNKGIKELQSLNVIGILPDMNDRRRNTYSINPYVAWKGTPIDRQKAIKHTKNLFVSPQQTLFIENNNE